MSFKFFRNLAFGFVLINAVGAFQSFKLKELNNFSSNSDIKPEKHSLGELNSVRNLPNIGFGNVFSNLIFLQFLQYFGDEQARKSSGYALSPSYFSAILEHNPYYKDFYFFLSESTTFHAGMPAATVDMMQQGLSALERERPSDSYFIWRYKGSDELLFLDDGEEAQRSFEMAAEWAKESEEEGSDFIADISAQTANFLASNPDSNQAKISSWTSILTTTLDRGTQERAIRNIRALGGDVLIGEDGNVSVQYSPIAEESQTDEKSDI